MELAQCGVAKKQIARQLGLDRGTVRHWIGAGAFPERKPVHRRSSVDAYAAHLNQRWEHGCHNASQLWRELSERGFGGQASLVRNWIRQRHGPHSNRKELAARPSMRASPRHTAWLPLTEPAPALPYLEELYRQSPQLAQTASTAREFVRLVRERDAAAWPGWLLLAQTTWLADFATHFIRDQEAVVAALNLPWSNGQVEGQVHRLKLLKRQMYGRAGFDLLRLRVLNAA